ncbi:rCG59737, isoform CRA_a [Rattus norvegicus]|uniref:RCG59737, isoform CRA_a n=1 Tax=Rattus norvegicus TaxID=10116 RepID=A6HSM1_RAT|nr:rCG59737, isoform CRA_a [Rattus norvegicus]
MLQIGGKYEAQFPQAFSEP